MVVGHYHAKITGIISKVEIKHEEVGTESVSKGYGVTTAAFRPAAVVPAPP